jgi:hypothetical protein
VRDHLTVLVLVATAVIVVAIFLHDLPWLFVDCRCGGVFVVSIDRVVGDLCEHVAEHSLHELARVVNVFARQLVQLDRILLLLVLFCFFVVLVLLLVRLLCLMLVCLVAAISILAVALFVCGWC